MRRALDDFEKDGGGSAADRAERVLSRRHEVVVAGERKAAGVEELPCVRDNERFELPAPDRPYGRPARWEEHPGGRFARRRAHGRNNSRHGDAALLLQEGGKFWEESATHGERR